MSRAALVISIAAMVAGCGGGTESRCPPEFPIERDGYCYAVDGGGPAMDGGNIDSGRADSGGDRDDSAVDPDAIASDAMMGTDAGGSEAGAICVGEHPLVMGTSRYCNPGDCFCADPDMCFPSDVAAACCNVPAVCDADGGTPPDGSAVICTGTHPLVMGTRRYCNPGECFCATPDNCFPMDTASACCMVPVVCE